MTYVEICIENFQDLKLSLPPAAYCCPCQVVWCAVWQAHQSFSSGEHSPSWFSPALPRPWGKSWTWILACWQWSLCYLLTSWLLSHRSSVCQLQESRDIRNLGSFSVLYKNRKEHVCVSRTMDLRGHVSFPQHSVQTIYLYNYFFIYNHSDSYS